MELHDTIQATTTELTQGVPRAIERWDEAVKRVETLIQMLDGRAESFLRPHSEAVGSRISEQVRPPQSPLAQMLDGRADQLDQLCDRLGDIVERIDL